MNSSLISFAKVLSRTLLILFTMSSFRAYAQNPDSVCTRLSLEQPGIVNTQQIHSAVATADLNRDGIPDGIVTIPDLDLVSIFLTNNDGTFQTERSFAAGDGPQGVAIADLNNDGELDLAITSQLDHKVNILLGDGNGGFSPVSSMPAPGTTLKVAAGDLNNDGWQDLVVASTSVQVFFGSRSGFGPATVYSTPLAATNISIADFNNDHRLDVAATYAGSSSDGGVQVYLNNGQGGLNLADTVSDTTRMQAISTSDFNNDGFIDIAFTGQNTNSTPSKMIVLLGDGNGTFTQLPAIQASAFAGLAGGDFNGDGKIDLATSDGGVYLGNGDGTFSLVDGLYPIVFPNDIATADFDGDGNLDLIEANAWRSRVYVYSGKGDGHFPGPVGLPITQRPASTAADFNGDGRLDVATMEGNGTVYLSLQNPDGSLEVTGNGPIFISGTSIVTTQNTVVAADFNGDGKPDLAFTVSVLNQLVVLMNRGDGTFTNHIVSLGFPSQRPEVVRVADLNNDGFKDIVVTNRNSSNFTVILGNGDGTFSVRTEQQTVPGSFALFLAVNDIDLDGKQDLLISRGTTTLYFFKGNGDGTFQSPQQITVSRPVSSIDVVDFNDDGLPDIAITSGGSAVSYFVRLLNSGHGTFLSAEYAAPGGSSDSIDLVVADFDRDGTKDVILGSLGFPQNTAGFFHGTAGGNFDAAQPFENFGGKPFSSADFNNDGIPDYAATGAVYINNALTAPCLSINDSSLTEPDTGTAAMDFPVHLSSSSDKEVSVHYKVIGRNAQPRSDLDDVSGTLTFPPGSTLETIHVPVKGDQLNEADEVFNVELTSPINASILDKQGKGTILDNDPIPTVNISDVSMAEGSGGNSRISFNLALNAPSGRETKVRFQTQDGTANSPSDYMGANGVFPIEAGLTNKRLSIDVVPDTLVEPDESFSIHLSNPIFLNISNGDATGTLTNDDIGGTVQLNAGVFNVNENDGSATITISRLNGNASNIVVQYSTSNETAIAGQDYSQVNGSVTFGANENSKTFSVPIINDNLDEDDTETVNVTLIGVSGGATLGAPLNGLLNIHDDDPLPQLNAENISIIEGNSGTTTALVPIRLTTPSGREVRVNYSTVDGSATSPADYTAISGTVIFSPGETVKNVPISIIPDRQPESNENFQLVLSVPVNAFLNRSAATITIATDDGHGTPFDLDGDGKTDIGIFRPSAGEWWYSRSSDAQVKAGQFGLSTDIITPGDFTGDGKADIAFYRPSTGFWFILRSEDGSFFSFPFGSNGDIPMPADFDGDGKTDAAVFRPSTGTWYILQSSGAGTGILQFGSNGDKPVSFDYDGDGKADIGIVRDNLQTGNKEWWILRSTQGILILNFGLPGDLTVSGDYTGDGKADVAFFRPSSGFWYILRSEDNSFFSFPFGTNGDIPAPGDYDGDGKSDAAVFRPSTSTWFVNRSGGSGTLIAGFGLPTDQPIPSCLVR